MIFRSKLLLSLFVLITSSVHAQDVRDAPEAVLVDEFGAISCEDILARTDMFFAELSNYPADTGLVVIYSSGRNPKGYLRFITSNSYLRRFDRSRLRIVMASDTSEMNGRLWRIPPGADLPAFTQVSGASPDFSKAFLYGSHFDENVCPSVTYEEFAEILQKRPGSTAKIVVTGPDWVNRKQQADADVEGLGRYGVSRNRIKILFVHRPRVPLTEAEYWFIPGPGKDKK